MDKLHIASCPFGKDSIATILLALENNEPLDRVIFCEVMFDHSRNISGDDGLSSRLDAITFPAWRRESIKAYGNAIVPQVFYQIGLTINEYENTNN